MSKSALGRGLGQLLAERPAPVAQDAAGLRVYVSPGVRTILQAGNGEKQNGNETVERVASPALADYWPLFRIVLVATDLLLLALCAVVALRAEGTMTFVETVVCIIAFALGAALACAAIAIKPTAFQQSTSCSGAMDK